METFLVLRRGCIRNGCADSDESAATTAEVHKHAYYARTDEGCCKMTTLDMESFKRLDKTGSKLVYQLATSMVRLWKICGEKEP